MKGTLVLVTQVDWPREIVASTDDEWVARYDKAWSLIEDSNLISDKRQKKVHGQGVPVASIHTNARIGYKYLNKRQGDIWDGHTV